MIHGWRVLCSTRDTANIIMFLPTTSQWVGTPGVKATRYQVITTLMTSRKSNVFPGTPSSHLLNRINNLHVFLSVLKADIVFWFAYFMTRSLPLFLSFSVCNVLFALAAFRVFYLSLVFSNLVVMCCAIGFLAIVVLNVYSAGSLMNLLDPWVYRLHQVLKKFEHFFKYFSPCSLSFGGESNYTYVRSLDIVL